MLHFQPLPPTFFHFEARQAGFYPRNAFQPVRRPFSLGEFRKKMAETGLFHTIEASCRTSLPPARLSPDGRFPNQLLHFCVSIIEKYTKNEGIDCGWPGPDTCGLPEISTGIETRRMEGCPPSARPGTGLQLCHSGRLGGRVRRLYQKR